MDNSDKINVEVFQKIFENHKKIENEIDNTYWCPSNMEKEEWNKKLDK